MLFRIRELLAKYIRKLSHLQLGLHSLNNRCGHGQTVTLETDYSQVLGYDRITRPSPRDDFSGGGVDSTIVRVFTLMVAWYE